MRMDITSRKIRRDKFPKKFYDNRDTLIATFCNLLLSPDLWSMILSIVMLMNSGHNFLFRKEVCMVYLGDKEKNTVSLPHNAQRKHTSFGEIKQLSKYNKIAPRKRINFVIITLQIRTHIYKIIESWRYYAFLDRYWD